MVCTAAMLHSSATCSTRPRSTRRRRSIEFAGPVTALARVRCSTGAKHYLDLLTLVRLDGRWWIMSKVCHYDLVDDQARSAQAPTVGGE
jgi:Putative lumazine-binding